MKRIVVPEILDHLAHDDPEAERARRDLRRINFLMGNHRWFRRQLRHLDADVVIETGSGDGELLGSLAETGSKLIGIDFAPRPAGLPDRVDWISGDVFDTLPKQLDQKHEGERIAIVANLFLHHFDTESLRGFGRLMDRASTLCFSEPYRSRLSLAEGKLLYPFINRVTRHDLPVSIRAGFRQGELPDLLQLDRAQWMIREQVSLFGAYRLVALRTP